MPKPLLGYLRHVDPEMFMDQFSLVAINTADDIYHQTELSAVLFGVGTDVNPALYGEHPGSYTQSPDTRRDTLEKNVFKRCEERLIPMIGICRGAQLITIMTGGKLAQHVDGHAGSRHDITTIDGRVINVNSIHHQMMIPRFGRNRVYNATMLAHTITPRSARYLGSNDDEISGQFPIVRKEPEVVVYGGDGMPTCLAVQGHPEWEPPGSEFQEYTLELTQKYIIDKERVNHVVPV